MSPSLRLSLRTALLPALVFSLPFAPAPVTAGETSVDTAERVEPTPVQDDANLHDVRFLGESIGWAAGDHGTLWQTADGGGHWQFRNVPADVALRSISLLSDRVGWLAGGTTLPFTRLGVGVLFATRDGGQTWRTISAGRLPPLHFVRFFTPSEGVVVGEATTDAPTGVLSTHDGGKTWKPLGGPPHPAWRAADFSTSEIGILVGLNGAAARVDGQMADARGGGFGARGLHDVMLAGSDGWAVGDGALVLHTVNSGIAWQSPPTPLPIGAVGIFDFHAIAVRGPDVWIAGSPGSVVWHSPDAGATWTAQATGQTAPIERISFHSDTAGTAVGAFGSILRTVDGGATWQAMRGGGRRAAILSLGARSEDISFSVLAKHAGELGYRSVVVLPFRGDGSGGAALNPQFDVRLHDSVAAAGGAEGKVGWRFPLEIPGIDRNVAQLRAEWMRRTEGEFPAAFSGALVCQIRTWRPTIVLVDRSAADDAAGNVLEQAAIEAVRNAADSDFCPDHRELAALGPWRSARVFARLPGESRGDFSIQQQESLPRLRGTVGVIANEAASRLRPIDSLAAESEAFRLVEPPPSDDPSQPSFVPRDFFSGIGLAPGCDCRRRLPEIDVESQERERRMAARDRNDRAIARELVESPTHGAEMIGLLRSSTRGRNGRTAALQLILLADNYRRHAQWELAEATLNELIGRYPDEPATLDAMQWLLQYWIGTEPTYQRFRQIRVDDIHPEYHAERISQTIQNAVEAAQANDPQNPAHVLPAANAVEDVASPRRLQSTRGEWTDMTQRNRKQAALQLAALIQKSPALFRSPQIQLPLAALLRQTGLRSLPFETRASESADALDSVAPVGYSMLEPAAQKTVRCRSASPPPRLDSLLSDACWEQADEISLAPDGTPSADGGPHALVMVAYDSQNLYFAMSVPRVAGTRTDGPLTLGRQRDQDLSAFDRIALCIDVDRDFVTSYLIEIDQRGCVRDSCWDDSNWNPRMGISAQGDGDRWRVEGAIPFTELVPRPPQAGETWNLAVIRTVPAVRLESWMHPASARPRPESFGVLRFE